MKTHTKNIDNLNIDGRLVIIAFLKGAKAELSLSRFMVKRQTITASTLRAQSNESKAAIAKELKDRVWPLFTKGEVRPVIDSIFPLNQASMAHKLMESNKHIGKILLSVSGD